MASIEKRTSRDGKTTYRVKVRLKGQPTESASFERLTDAKKWAHFPLLESGLYQSPNFDSASDRAEIDIETGLGKVTVR